MAPMVQGRAAVDAMLQSWPPVTRIQTNDEEAGGSGNMAYIRGTYELAMQVNDITEVNDAGKDIEVWKKSNGHWRCTHDIFNSDAAAQ